MTLTCADLRGLRYGRAIIATRPSASSPTDAAIQAPAQGAVLLSAEVRYPITRLGNLVATRGRAEGAAEAELCAALGLRLTYRPNERQIDVVATPRIVDVSACRRGDTRAKCRDDPWQAWLVAV